MDLGGIESKTTFLLFSYQFLSSDRLTTPIFNKQRFGGSTHVTVAKSSNSSDPGLFEVSKH